MRGPYVSLAMSDSEVTYISHSKQWMISMDGYEGYITIATYDKPYVDFLYDDLLSEKTSFMVMHEYGPFDLRICKTTEVHGLESFLKAVAVLMDL